MKKHIYLAVYCLSILPSFGAQEAAVQQLQLKDFLHDAGNKCDVYFTVEGACPSNMFSDVLMLEDVFSKGAPGDISAVISSLTNSITNLTVTADASNKRIYHVIDSRLLVLDDYAMNRVLESIKFDGDAETFVSHIEQGVPNLLNQSIFGSTFIALNDATAISISYANVSVRDALSNGVDLRGYNRLIWTAFTPLETRQTEVHFLGKTNRMEH